ncbi:MAG: cobyric acid synthase [Salinivirgaceae bacterium]|nr:cobyric acid synthase [Salinivirgaceae bacterium]
MQKLKPVMFVGTGSDVGKSIINAAFCRIFKQDGYSPAPFKAQNMSLNSYATPDGKEIGRAQAVQAEACGIDCMVEMNPILLKPTSNQNAQVVLNGKPIGKKSAKEYFLGTDREMLFAEAMKSFWTLDAKYNPVVVEGAGSISEMNLWDKDITNMRVALAANATTFLIADIDRGGVFASVYGTMQLLPENERKLIKGIIINKFRGDIDLFEDGKKMLEELTGIPVVSIIPYYRDIFIDDEDSVVLDKKIASFKDGKINIAVVLLRHMSNFTDFNVLERIPEVHLFYTYNADDILNADVVLIPGSKNTIEDLLYLQKTGLAKAIVKSSETGKAVYGICGGYQMMGEEIADPNHVEGEVELIKGLGLLPVKTTLTHEKTTEQCEFSFQNKEEICQGYEIHMGETISEKDRHACVLKNGKTDGYFKNSKTWGSYIHGIFDNISIINEIVKTNGGNEISDFDLVAFKDLQYNKLAELVRQNSDMKYIYKTLTE